MKPNLHFDRVKYLEIRDFKARQYIFKFRIKNMHAYKYIEKAERLCSFRNQNRIEDEQHFLC